MANQYIVGTQLKLTGTFTNENGVDINPDRVGCSVIDPNGVRTVLDGLVVNESVGVFSVLYTPKINGLHMYRFESTGLVEAASENSFTAQTSFAA